MTAYKILIFVALLGCEDPSKTLKQIQMDYVCENRGGVHINALGQRVFWTTKVACNDGTHQTYTEVKLPPRLWPNQYETHL